MKDISRRSQRSREAKKQRQKGISSTETIAHSNPLTPSFLFLCFFASLLLCDSMLSAPHARTRHFTHVEIQEPHAHLPRPNPRPPIRRRPLHAPPLPHRLPPRPLG